MNLLEQLLDHYAVLVDPTRPIGDVDQINAGHFIRARLSDLGEKDTDRYYKAIPAIRDRVMGRWPAGDVEGEPAAIEVEVTDAALPDPGLSWEF